MAVILDIPPESLRWDISQKDTEVSRRYYRGKAASKVKLLHQEMLLAQVGSPLAIENTIAVTRVGRTHSASMTNLHRTVKKCLK